MRIGPVACLVAESSAATCRPLREEECLLRGPLSDRESRGWGATAVIMLQTKQGSVAGTWMRAASAGSVGSVESGESGCRGDGHFLA